MANAPPQYTAQISKPISFTITANTNRPETYINILHINISVISIKFNVTGYNCTVIQRPFKILQRFRMSLYSDPCTNKYLKTFTVLSTLRRGEKRQLVCVLLRDRKSLVSLWHRLPRALLLNLETELQISTIYTPVP